MTVIATALKHLLAAGVSGDDLVRAIQDIEAAQAGGKPRSLAAIRQAQYRERKLAQKEAEDITGDVTDVTLRNSHNGRNEPREVRSITHQAELAIWNEVAGRNGLPLATTCTGKRQAMLRQRLAEHGADAFRRACEAVERSPFLLGKNDRGWKADIGFLLRPDNFVKLLEGGYGPIDSPKPAPRPMNAEQLRAAIRFAEDHDDLDRVAELKIQLAALVPADPRVARIVEGASRSLAVSR